MNSKMMAAGIALVFVAMALPSNAYHVTSAGPNDIDNPHKWTARLGASFPIGDPTGPVCTVLAGIRDGIITNADGAIQSLVPPLTQEDADLLKELVAVSATLAYDLVCLPDGTILGFDQNDGIIGFTACEQNAGSTPGAPSHAGFGGLCFMNPGFSGADCAATGPRSNGVFNAYDGGPCKPASATRTTPTELPARVWIEVTMQDHNNANVAFLNDCGTTGTKFLYDEQYYYTMFGGHVSGFPTQDIGAGNYGTYQANVVASASGTVCSAPLPVYWS